MAGREESNRAAGRTRPVTYCIIPRDLARKLHEPLRRHFDDDPNVEVIVERRGEDRRLLAERRAPGTGSTRVPERRKIHAVEGRRVADRRALLGPAEERALPRKARPHAERIVFGERVEPAQGQIEDDDTARLVTKVQAGDHDTFALIYVRYFDRIYNYLRVVLNDPDEAEDATQQVFLQMFEALPRYEHRGHPFRVWVFAIVRNHAIRTVKRRSRTEPVDPVELAERSDRSRASDSDDMLSVDWITDKDLLLLVERLPLAQRQVLVLRYVLDLTHAEIAAVLQRSPEDVRVMAHRAQRFLRDRLASLGRVPTRHGRARMERWPKKAPVLRARRFAIGRPG